MLQVAAAIIVIAAGASDLVTRRIPNWITVPGAAGGLVLHGYYGGWGGALSSLGGAGLGLGIFLLFYLAGGMGAGDVKLSGAVGALVGAQAYVLVFVATGLVGGIAALCLAMSRGRLRQTLARTASLLGNFGRLRWAETRSTVSLDSPDALRLPYGAVIAAGTLLFLALFP